MRVLIFCIVAFSSIFCFAQSKKGIVKTYFPNGNVKSITQVENGKKNGKEELFWQDGSTFMIQYFKNDMLVDSFYQYDERHPEIVLLKGYCTPKSHYSVRDTANRIIADGEYSEGMIVDGFSRIFFDNENVAGIIQRVNGKKNGILVSYYPNGNIQRIVHYKEDIKIPPIIEFDSTGKMVKYVPVKK